MLPAREEKMLQGTVNKLGDKNKYEVKAMPFSTIAQIEPEAAKAGYLQ